MKPKILYLDDEKENLSSFKFLFKREFDIEVIDSPEKALSLLKEEHFHIIVSDQRMPEMTGSEFLEQVYLKYPNCIRILLTGYSDVDSIVNAINKAQIFYFIAKPFELDEVKEIFYKAFTAYNEKFNEKTEDKISSEKLKFIDSFINKLENYDSEKWKLCISDIKSIYIKLNKELKILDVNDYFLNISQFEKEDLIGKDFLEFSNFPKENINQIFITSDFIIKTKNNQEIKILGDITNTSDSEVSVFHFLGTEK